MAIAFRSDNTLAIATRVNSTINAPAGLADGDIIELTFVSDTDATLSTPTGFTKNPASAFNYAGTALWAHRFERRAASEGASYTTTHTSRQSSGYIRCFSGGLAAGDWNDVAPTTNSGTSTNGVGTGLTTATDGTMLLFTFFGDGTNAATSTPAGMTEDEDGAGPSGIFAAYSELRATAGATGDRTTVTTSQQFGTFMATIKPAVVASTFRGLGLLGAGT